ncbi:uncharacterized protein Dana_GF28098 [Drosophila ananassae]|uniref:Kazal-like domain-containing protein n=1 Tax=Drosophila ananassae TaxID=7217 RepID=A0A0P8XUH6_DROAN|nr:U-Kazal-Dg21.2-like [Drosophila ananassae]KPU78376.1 uncharacterized protein Dana_GF28098 [Drosophila ananassae]
MKAFTFFLLISLVILELTSGERCVRECDNRVDPHCAHAGDCYLSADNLCDLEWKACLRSRRRKPRIIDVTRGQCSLDKEICEENFETFFHTNLNFK